MRKLVDNQLLYLSIEIGSYSDEHGQHDKWGLFLCADRPPMPCFPAWSLIAIAAGIFAWAMVAVLAPAGRRS
jgi:hypothetical protein